MMSISIVIIAIVVIICFYSEIKVIAEKQKFSGQGTLCDKGLKCITVRAIINNC